MTRIFAFILAIFVASAAAAEGCFPFCDTNTWKSVQCGALCNVQFWNDASAADVRAIFTYGPSVNGNVMQGWEPIHFAAKFGTAEGVFALLEAGADPNGHAQETGIETPLISVLSPEQSQFRDVISANNSRATNLFTFHENQLIHQPENYSRYRKVFNEVEIHRITPIISALILAGAEINIRGTNGQTPLLNSVKYGATEITRMLVEAGADVNMAGDTGSSPLHHAITLVDGATVAKILIDAGADIDQLSIWGNTVLSNAVSSRNIDLIKIVIAAGANINQKDEGGETPFSSLERYFFKYGYNYEYMITAYPHIAEISELLLQAGAVAGEPTLQQIPAVSAVGSEEAEFPLLKEFLGKRGNQVEYPTLPAGKVCTQKIRRGVDVLEIIIPCPDE